METATDIKNKDQTWTYADYQSWEYAKNVTENLRKPEN